MDQKIINRMVRNKNRADRGRVAPPVDAYGKRTDVHLMQPGCIPDGPA